MLSRLRIRLTLLYLLVALLLIVLVGGISYSLLFYYFQTTNDLALQFKMAETFETLGVEVPPELAAAEQAWLGRRSLSDSKAEANEAKKNGEENNTAEDNLNAYEGELSTIFIFPLDSSGMLVLNPNPFTPPMQPDQEAAQAARSKGSDLRTLRLKDGTPVRLLTYQISPETGFQLIQLGRPFADQEQVLSQFITGLSFLSILSALLLGLGSWWLAGRSLIPTQRAWEMQQTFVANASHELRTPLTLVRASAELALRKTPEGSQQQELFADVICECDHMTALVEDLLLLSRLDSHQLKLERQVMLLSELAGEVHRQFEPLAEQNRVQLVIHKNNAEILGDRMRLRQVMLILLDNALQHTPQGGRIEINIIKEGRWAKMSVSDTGEGISQENLAHVFERFFQAQQPVSGEEKRGSGLGLAIAKSLVEAHDGQIFITSQPGQGTTVNIQIPAVKSFS